VKKWSSQRNIDVAAVTAIVEVVAVAVVGIVYFDIRKIDIQEYVLKQQ